MHYELDCRVLHGASEDKMVSEVGDVRNLDFECAPFKHYLGVARLPASPDRTQPTYVSPATWPFGDLRLYFILRCAQRNFA